MIVLDTHVVSEAMKPKPDPAVMAFDQSLRPKVRRFKAS